MEKNRKYRNYAIITLSTLTGPIQMPFYLSVSNPKDVSEIRREKNHTHGVSSQKKIPTAFKRTERNTIHNYH